MRNLKRALSLTLASVMLLGMMVVGAGAAGYPDVNEDDHNIEAIEVLQAVKVMQGNEQGNFDPDSPVNRSQMAVVMANLLNLDYNYYEGTCPFWDVPDWAKPYVAACYANGIVSGYNATTYGAADSVTAVQAASMMMRALGYFQYQEDYDNNGGFEMSTVKQANQIGLFDGLNANATGALTRNQVAKLALNALEANMVDFTGTPGTSIDLGDGKKVNVGYKAEYTYRSGTEKKYAALSNLGDTTNVIGSGAQGRYYIQLGEELYNGDLTKADSTDEFDRPTITWKYDYKQIGEYLKDPDLTYTKDVKLSDIYKDLGLANALVADKVDFYDNGKGEKEDENNDIVDNGGTKAVNLSTLGLSKNTGNKIGAKGVLLQVWYDDDREEATITLVDTYVGKIATIGNAKDDDRYVTMRDHSFDANKVGGSMNNKFETPDFEVKDLVTFTAAWNNDSHQYDIQTVETLELSATGVLTRWEGKNIYDDDKGTTDKNFTAGGTKYDYSANKLVVDEDGAKVLMESFDVNESEVNVYLDKYGYAIYVSGVEGTKNYAALIGYGAVNQYGSQTRGATLLLPDGTQQEVIAKLPDGKAWGTYVTSASGDVAAPSTSNLVDDGVADIVTYTVGDDGIYKLTVVDSTASNVVPADKAFATGNYSTNAKSVDTDFVNGRSVMTINTKYADAANGYTTAAKGTYYTTSETIFFVATPKSNSTDYEYNVYTGYANAPSLVDTANTINGVAFALDSFYTNQINAVYIDATRTAGISDVDTYFVKEKDATIYTDSDGRYFELPAVVDNEETTIRIEADVTADWNVDGVVANGETLASVNGTAAMFAIKNVTKNSKGMITGCDIATFNAANGNKSNVGYGMGIGTVNTRADVLGIGATEASATYWSWKSDVKCYWVDYEYKTISIIDIKSIGTDNDDLVYAIHDGDTYNKKLTDVVVIEVNTGNTPKYSVLASTGVKFSTDKVNWKNTLTGTDNQVKKAGVYVIANDVAYKPTSGLSLTLVDFTADGQGVYKFAMPGESVVAGSFGTDKTGYGLVGSLSKTAEGTVSASYSKNSTLTADEAKPGVGATTIVYTFQKEGAQGWTNLQESDTLTTYNAPAGQSFDVRVVVSARVGGVNGVVIASETSATWNISTPAAP